MSPRAHASIDHPARGRYVTVGNPIKLSASPTTIGPSPLLGQHTDEILESLGYAPERIAAGRFLQESRAPQALRLDQRAGLVHMGPQHRPQRRVEQVERRHDEHPRRAHHRERANREADEQRVAPVAADPPPSRRGRAPGRAR